MIVPEQMVSQSVVWPARKRKQIQKLEQASVQIRNLVKKTSVNGLMTQRGGKSLIQGHTGSAGKDTMISVMARGLYFASSCYGRLSFTQSPRDLRSSDHRQTLSGISASGTQHGIKALDSRQPYLCYAR